MGSTAYNTVFPDAGTLIAMADQMVESVNGIRGSFAEFLSSGNCTNVVEQIDRFGGIARVLNLRVAFQFSHALTQFVRGESQTSKALNDDDRADFESALLCLEQFVASARAGVVPSGLFFQECWSKMASKNPEIHSPKSGNLFFPLTVSDLAAPKSFDGSKFLALIEGYRNELKTNVEHLRSDPNKNNINQLRTTLMTMEAKMPPPSVQLLLSSSICLVDDLIRNGRPVGDLEIESIDQLEQSIAQLGPQNLTVSDEAISSLLYSIARTDLASARRRSIDEAYEVTRLYQQFVGAKSKDHARVALESCNLLMKLWESASLSKTEISEIDQAAENFDGCLQRAADSSSTDLSSALGQLLKTIRLTHDVSQSRQMWVIGASVLLAIKERLEAISKAQVPSNSDQVSEAIQRVANCLNGTSEKKELTTHLAGSYSSTILLEIANNISACEQIVDQCLRDGSKESKVTEAVKLFSMANSALMLMNMQEACQFAEIIESDLQTLLNKSWGDDRAPAADTQKLAQAFLHFGKYVRIFGVDPAQAKAELKKGLALYETPSDATPEAIPQAVEAGVYDECTDEELGPIFFEEAKDIISNVITPGIHALRADQFNERAFLEVRRGFHTLKGSARMVDLNNLGMIGQYAEYVLNVCRDNAAVKPTLPMLNWLTNAASTYATAIELLERGNRAYLMPDAFKIVHDQFIDTGKFVGEEETSEIVDGLSHAESIIPASSSQALDSVDAVAQEDLVEQVLENPDTPQEPHDPKDQMSAEIQVEVSIDLENQSLEMPLALHEDNNADSSQIEALPISVEPVHAEELTTNDVESHESIPIAESVGEVGESAPDVVVGSTIIPSTLYGIFLTESRKYFDELEALLLQIIKGQRSVVDFEVVRLTHSIAGMTRTTGLSAITEICADIESWASAMKDHRLPICDEHKGVLRDFLEALESMIMGVNEKMEPQSDQALVSRIKQMLADVEHQMAHGQEQQEVSESFLKRVENGQAINDTNSLIPEIVETTALAPSLVPEEAPVAKTEEGELTIHVIAESSIIMAANASVVVDANAMEKLSEEAHQWLESISSKDDDIDPEMLGIFIEEADLIFEEIDASLSGLAVDAGDKKHYLSLKRAMHTLKGSSNTAGARKVGMLFHYLEDLMSNVTVLTAALVATIQGGVDASFAGIEALKSGRSVESAIRKSLISNSRVKAAQETGGNSDDVGASTTTVVTSSIISSSIETSGGSTQSTVSTQVERDAVDSDDLVLRVTAKSLDRMVKNVGEVAISRSRIHINLEQSKASLFGLSSTIDRMSGYLQAIELEAEKQMFAGSKGGAADSVFDALQMDRFTKLQELTRRVSEAQNDILMQQSQTLSSIKEIDEAIATQHILISDLTSDMDQIRRVRVSSVVPSLKRIVRAACRESGKMGNIYFDADVEVDRGILDKVITPLGHILRNAIAHGIEFPQERISIGKNKVGSIEFKAYQDGNEVVISVHDDGAGIHAQKVLSKAVEKGIVKPGTRMADDKIYELLFEPGFSTADNVTELAGRGVGLDVVRTQISAMGGRIDIRSTPGSGTSFVLRLPATLTVISGVSVSADGHMYVIPVSFIDRLVRVGSRELDEAYQSGKLVLRDAAGDINEYDFAGLWQVVGSKRGDAASQEKNSVLLMRTSKTAVHVEDIKTAAEFVFRPMGPQLVVSSGLIGSTIMASGLPALVLDPGRVMKNSLSIGDPKSGENGVARGIVYDNAVRTPLVMIVDDSMTVRKVTTRLLKKEGFRSIEAENGMQALERVQLERPDVILMDIEMPVMNGFEAVQALRASAQFKDIPVIMITSRVGDSHRQKAMGIGVNAYLGKPYNDTDLVTLIRQFSGIEEVVNA